MTWSNLFIVFAIAAVILPTASINAATEFWVGGPSGWTVDVDYQAWAADKVFRVGDSLVFNYTKGVHNVFKVNGTEFAACTKPSENLALASGHDVVTLKATGKKWYICGKGNHCSERKQKLVINVEEEAPAPAPEPTSSAYAILIATSYQVFMAAAVALGIIAVLI